MAADRVLALSLAAWALGLALALHLGGVRVIREAGLYQLEIARHMAAGAGSTFDGLHATNGYHPLWLLILVPLFWIASGRETALALTSAVQALFMAACALLLYRTARREASPPAAALAATLWLALTYREALSGLEFGVHAASVLALALAYRRWREREAPSLGAGVAVGALAAIAFLARLDNVLLGVLVVAAVAARDWRARPTFALMRAAACAAPLLVTVAAYGLLNARLFGAPLPVSASVVWEWSRLELQQDPLYQAGGWWLAKAHHITWPLRSLPRRYPLYLVLGGYAAGVLALLRVRGVRAWAPLAAFSTAQLVAYALVFHGEFSFQATPPAFVVQPWLFCLLAAAAAERLHAAVMTLPVRPRRAAAAALLALGALPAVLTALSGLRWSRRERSGVSIRPDHDAARWARAHLPAGAVVGTWRTGGLAYLSGLRVVDLSGLVNSWDYHRHERQDLCDYWSRNGVSHLIDLFEDGRPPIQERGIQSYAACAERLERVWSDDRYRRHWRIEAYRLRPSEQQWGGR